MKKYSLYSDILTSKGFCRSLLFDKTRSTYYLISNEVYEFLQANNFKSFDLKLLPIEFRNLFIENDLIYETDDRNESCLITMDLSWDFPFQITNFVIELSDEIIEHLVRIAKVDFVSHIHIVVNQDLEINTIDKLFQFLNFQICDSVEFSFIINLEDLQLNAFKQNIKNLNKIVKILNYANLDFEEVFEMAQRYGIITDPCTLKLSKSVDHFFESQNHHTYFNRKLFINATGNIKNAPESKNHFGNISKIRLSDELLKIVESDSFKEHWFITKNNTDICKDCEFKNICVDNRLPLKRSENEWYHKTECIYNPYIAKWRDEEGYKDLTTIGVISDEEIFSIDLENIRKINSELWEEV